MHDEIAALIARSLDHLGDNPSLDEARSARFAAAEAHIAAGSDPDGANSRVNGWVRRVRELTEFTLVEDRFPRENNRAPAGVISSEESSLHEWVRLQRRSTTRDNHCDYQIQRLNLVPGFSWDPHDEAWQKSFELYQSFITVHGQAPRVRSQDTLERSLAHWAAKQRSQHRRNRLDDDRKSALQSLFIWAW